MNEWMIFGLGFATGVFAVGALILWIDRNPPGGMLPW